MLVKLILSGLLVFFFPGMLEEKGNACVAERAEQAGSGTKHVEKAGRLRASDAEIADHVLLRLSFL